jgi:hypothetical protein
MGMGEIPLRITLVHPPRDVVFCLQRGKEEIVSPVRATGGDLSFELSVRVREGRPDGPPNFLGPFTQGPPAARFVYVNSGTSAGEAGSCWTRRAKVPLSGITWALIEEALAAPDTVLEARIAGMAGDGGPACATVPLLEGGWRIAKAQGATVNAEPSADARIDRVVRATDPKLQEIIRGLRELIQDVVPEVKETVNPWGMPTFELNGPMGYFMVAAKHITFGFQRGTSLTDPKGLLEGTGKNLRHVKLRKVEDLQRDGLRQLVEEAARLNRETPAPAMGRGGKKERPPRGGL